MQHLKRSWVVASLGAIAAGFGLTTSAWAREEAQTTSPQIVDAQPSLQGAPIGAPTAVVPQSQVAYQTVNTVECVTVPVTQMQTQYRTEVRTENVPVTRMVPETVNETRTITRFIPHQETINKQVITNYVCEPVTTIKKCYRPIPVTKNVTKTLYQTYCRSRKRTRSLSKSSRTSLRRCLSLRWCLSPRVPTPAATSAVAAVAEPAAGSPRAFNISR
jgi:hypothetical protein